MGGLRHRRAVVAADLGQLVARRKLEDEARAVSDAAFHFDRSTMTRHDTVGDAHAQAGAGRAFRREEGIEDVTPHFIAHPDPAVADFAAHGLATLADEQFQRPALRHRINRIEDQIREDFP